MKSSTHSLWLPYRRPRLAVALRLFCLPHAGGGASVFRGWEALMPPWIELCAVQLPGREARLAEQPYRELEPLLDELVFALEPFCDVPFAFFGHSLGALLSYEVAHRLSARGHLPVMLFAAGRNPPDTPVVDPVSDLPDDELLTHLVELDGIPQEILASREMIDLMLPVVRADIRISESRSGRPVQALACSVSAFAGILDPWAGEELMRGWSRCTEASFRLRMFPGNHFFVRTATASLLRCIVQDLLTEAPGLANRPGPDA